VGFAPHSLTPSELSAVLEAERAGVAFLAFRDGLGDLRIAPLTGGLVVIGRAAQSDIVLDWDREVSRTHAQLERIGGDWVVMDGGLSRNGCVVNTEPLVGRRRLTDGDVVGVGATTLVFRTGRGADDDGTLAANAAEHARLTEAERRVLDSLCRPMLAGVLASPASNLEIAAELCISPASVKTHMRSLFSKLDVGPLPQNHKRAVLARRAIESGLVAALRLPENGRSS
jgi:pSer/pThr/pTyr-binding forkhead associated (FHA) protein